VHLPAPTTSVKLAHSLVQMCNDQTGKLSRVRGWLFGWARFLPELVTDPACWELAQTLVLAQLYNDMGVCFCFFSDTLVLSCLNFPLFNPFKYNKKLRHGNIEIGKKKLRIVVIIKLTVSIPNVLIPDAKLNVRVLLMPAQIHDAKLSTIASGILSEQ